MVSLKFVLFFVAIGYAMAAEEEQVRAEQDPKKLLKSFDVVEDKLKEKINDKMKDIRNSLNGENTKKGNKNKSKTSPKIPVEEIFIGNTRRVENTKPVLDEVENGEELEPTGTELPVVSKEKEKKKDSEQSSIDKTTVDPDNFMSMETHVLESQIPDEAMKGDEILDDNDGKNSRNLDLAEAFAEDDVVNEFRSEKENEIKNAAAKDIDLSLPGWGHWAGEGLSKLPSRRSRRFLIKAPKLPRRDAKNPNVIINESMPEKLKDHLVKDVPYPFNTVKDYEASIRAPLGNTFIPRSAFESLTKPEVVRKMGTVIEPMSEDQLKLANQKKEKLKLKKGPKKSKRS